MASTGRKASPHRTAHFDRHARALVHALAATAHGLSVIPLTSGKLPAIRSPHHEDSPRHEDDDTAAAGPASAAAVASAAVCRGECGRLGHGIHDATAEPAAVRALFAAAPWATGYGIACGTPPHRLIGVDLDLKGRTDGMAALRELAREHAFTIPRTVTVLTPSGGRHLWFTGPPGREVPNSVGRPAPGIDIRGAGGYLAGPGSYTPRGTYRLSPTAPGWPPAEAPPELLNLIAPLPPHRRAPKSAEPPGPDSRLVAFVRNSRAGHRNDRLFWAACRAYESGAGDELAPALLEAARSTGLPEREARATIASAARAKAR
ncbi:bifunctional DNA primase/polymerase [Streptomyces sp. NPDC057654]|uniref:bifunctional DNA primase/polymerase n=1 Tax=Streptomyces sp. NPDC057654 TaxID=3346196 RepID=UPI0036CEA048